MVVLFGWTAAEPSAVCQHGLQSLGGRVSDYVAVRAVALDPRVLDEAQVERNAYCLRS